MKIAKSEVMSMLGISKLDNEIAENVLELCQLYPVLERSFVYDGEEVCRFCAKAATFYKEYLPEFYVSELLEINVDILMSMNIEYMAMPPEMQCIFYDRYQEGKFRYSKFVYNAIQVYKFMKVLSKSVYLKIPKNFVKYLNYPPNYAK